MAIFFLAAKKVVNFLGEFEWLPQKIRVYELENFVVFVSDDERDVVLGKEALVYVIVHFFVVDRSNVYSR